MSSRRQSSLRAVESEGIDCGGKPLRTLAFSALRASKLMPQLPAFSALRASNPTRRQAAHFLGAPRLETNAATTTARFLGASARASKPTPQLPTFETIALVLLGAARLVSNATRNVPKTDKDRGAARFLGASHLETKAAARFHGASRLETNAATARILGAPRLESNAAAKAARFLSASRLETNAAATAAHFHGAPRLEPNAAAKAARFLGASRLETNAAATDARILGASRLETNAAATARFLGALEPNAAAGRTFPRRSAPRNKRAVESEGIN